MKSLNKALFCLTATLLLLTNSGGVYAAVAGHVQFVHGKVLLTSAAGVTHTIRKGEAVSEGDTLISVQFASAQIRLEDGGFVAMRPDTKLKFDRFRFNGKQDGTEQNFLSLFKGGFRAITGLIGQQNKKNYHITTPASTIGIRGTDHETYVVTPDSELAATTPLGTYNKVNKGETTITTEKGTISVLPNQMGYAGAANQMPKLEPVNLNIFTVAAQPHANGEEGHDAKNESGAKESGDKGAKKGGSNVRESATPDNNVMRDSSSVDKVELQESATPDNSAGENTFETPTSGEGGAGGGGETGSISPTSGEGKEH